MIPQIERRLNMGKESLEYSTDYIESRANERNINLVISMAEELHERWHKSYEELTELDKKYSLWGVIASNYDYFNSMGTEGIALKLEEYIREHGGSIEL